jgi:hypothetical protein
MRIQDFSNTAEFLATMSRDQLKEYAQNNAGNPYLVSLALFVSDQQKAMDRSRQAKAQPQASVVDSAIENIAPMARATIPAEEVEFEQEMPEDTGIGQIPIDDTYYGANGGIIAFADEGLVTDPQFGGSIAQMEDDRPAPPKPSREQVNAIVQALRDNKQNVGLSTIRDIEEGKITAPTKSPVAAPQVVDLPPEVGVGSGRTPASTSAAPIAAPRGVAMPSSKPLGIQGLFDEAMGKVAVTESPYKSQLEALARERKEAAQADTAGLEKIQEKYGDITKGQRARQDAKEKEIAAMDNQGIGIGLLLYGAELMSKRNPDASVGVKGYLANRDRVAAARDKLSESRDRLEAAEAQRGELNATQLHKLRMNERKVGIEATEDMVKDIKERYNVSREVALKILDLQIKDAIALRGEERADRRTAMQIGAKEDTPTQQVFKALIAKNKGDVLKANAELQTMGEGTIQGLYKKEMVKKLAELEASPSASLLPEQQANIARLKKELFGPVASQTGKAPPPPPGFKVN